MYSARGGGLSARRLRRPARRPRCARIRRCRRCARPAWGCRCSQHGFGELLDSAMHHEAAILAAAHHLAFDIEAEMRRLVESGMEGAERHDRASLRRIVEFEFAVFVEALPGLDSTAHLCAADARLRASRPAARAVSDSDVPPARCRAGRAFRVPPSWRPGPSRRCCRS